MAEPRHSTPATGLLARQTFPISPCLSPIRRRSCLQEEALRDLNNRLATYIEGVRALRAAKRELQLRLAEEGRQVCLLRQHYDDELARARLLLDQQAGQRAAAQLQLTDLREQHNQLHARNSKKENDLTVAVTQIRDLEAQLHSKEADLATALSRQQSLEKDFQESKEQIVSLKETVKDIKTQLQDERLKKIDLENQIKMLQEQAVFRKNLHEHELQRNKNFYESRIEEIESGRQQIEQIESGRQQIEQIESGRQQTFQSKLLSVLQALRQEHEQQIEEYKKQAEQNYAAKVENAQLCAAKNSDFANSLLEELKKMKLRTESLTSQNAALVAQISELKDVITGLEKTVNSERNMRNMFVAEKDREMAEAQQQIQAQLKEFEQLLDVKLTLDLEISAYRAMLEREEKWFGLAKYSSESIDTHATTSQGRLFLQGKKRKRTLSETQVTTLDLKDVQHASSMGAISIEKMDTDGRFVRIKNISDKEQSLSEWTLRRQYSDGSDVMFQFPAEFTLQAGQLVTVWSARDKPQVLGSAFVWKSSGSGENINFVLLNSIGEEVAESKIIHAGGGGGDGSDGEKDQEGATKGQEEMELATQKKKKTRLV